MTEIIDFKAEIKEDKNNGIDLCIKHGQLNIIKEAIREGYEWRLSDFENAARYGQLEIMKYQKETNCPLEEDAWIYAAEFGHLRVLKWLYHLER
jgi:hypothetical protein